MRRLIALVTLAVLGAGAAPAGAVIGGTPVDAAAVPWFASVGGCGGTLVAPDRVLTAGHCVEAVTLADLRESIFVGGTRRSAARIALHPGWRVRNGGNLLEDVALVALDAPVPGVAPVALGSAEPGEARILGTGWTAPPGTGEGGRYGGGLREAVLRTMGDDDCAAAFRGQRGNDGERFDARRMRCAIDPDGLAPLSSGCNGDSGGPLYAGPATAPVLLGVVSWGGRRCGADHLPSVFADVARLRAFIADPAPTWAPASTSLRGRITGTARVGRTLTCRVSGPRPAGTEVLVSWHRATSRGTRAVGRGRTYRVTRADRGGFVVCRVALANDGGQAVAPPTPAARVRIVR